MVLYSQRLAVRDKAVVAEEKRLGRKLHNDERERAVIVRETRADKSTEISTAEVWVGQLARLPAGQFQKLEAVKTAVVETKLR